MIDSDYYEIRVLYCWVRGLDYDFIYDGYAIDAYHDYDTYIDDYD